MKVWYAEYEREFSIGNTKRSAMNALKNKVNAESARVGSDDGPLPDSYIETEKVVVHNDCVLNTFGG